jgi:NADPH:quinone reductase-like Zn-dependent oxidoreductase
MEAVHLHAYGGVDQLRYEDVPTPQPGPDEVLVKLAATSVNPIDWKIRSGTGKDRMPVKFPAILGRDVAGMVAKAGVNVRNPEPGQKVMGLVNGRYAEYVTARADHLTVVPDGLELEQAGTLPLVVTTGAQPIQHIRKKTCALRNGKM